MGVLRLTKELGAVNTGTYGFACSLASEHGSMLTCGRAQSPRGVLNSRDENS